MKERRKKMENGRNGEQVAQPWKEESIGAKWWPVGLQVVAEGDPKLTIAVAGSKVDAGSAGGR